MNAVAPLRTIRQFAHNSLWVASCALLIALMMSLTSFNGASAQTSTANESVVAEGVFERKRKNTRGGWTIVNTEEGRILRLADDFRTGNGPDIKVFLSPIPLSEVSGKTAVEGSVLLGQLERNRGAAELSIPADVDLASFESLLIHCEEYSVLFGGSTL